ncbi:MAG: leucine-rich repeat protein [Clostridia bacterium]|nr:leucine-rich repeat protein [Clostridia bacterium]
MKRVISALLTFMLLLPTPSVFAQGVIYAVRGDAAFVQGCDTSLSVLSVDAYYAGKRVSVIGANAFLGANAKELILPDTIEVFENGALYGMGALERLTTPASLREIGKLAFGACLSLQSVWLTAGVEKIEGNVFALCANLSEIGVDANNRFFTSYEGCLYTKDYSTLIACPAGKTGIVNVHKGAKTIAENAFSGCEKVTEVLLPEGLEHINSRAFFACDFAEITFPSSLKTIANAAFASCQNLRSITLPQEVYFVDAGAFLLCRSLTEINVGEDNINYFSNDGVLYSKPQNSLTLCPPGKRGAVYVAEGVTAVGDYAFTGALYVQDIVIPATVSYISPFAIDASQKIYGVVGSAAHFAAQDYGIEFEMYVEMIVDSSHIDCLPRLQGGALTLPVRTLAEFLELELDYEPQTNTVKLQSGDTSLEIQAQSVAAVLNGRSITLDAPPQIIDDTMYVPLRFITELFGCEVQWVNSIPAVIITTR